jgi:NADH dehydrogenase
MTTHVLHARQILPRPIEEVFAFFAPENLVRLIPPHMDFTLGAHDTRMGVGAVIEQRVRPLLGVPARWTSRIDAFDPPHRFVDIQARGPYRSWVHTHTFTPVETGTEVTDDVRYAVPFGPLGELTHHAVIGRELAHIFRFRTQALAAIFATPEPNERPMTIAVAGGTGFVGGAIAAELFRRGHRVIVLSHRGESARGWLPDSVEIRLADAARDQGLVEALEGADALVVALAFPNSPIEAPRSGRTFEAVDAAGTEHLVAAAGKAAVDRVLYVSGAGAAPDAARHWYRAKWRAEEAIRGSGMTWTIIRPTWIYGPRDVSLNRFLRFGRQLLAVPMSSLGRQLLAPVFVDDAARLAADSLADAAAENHVFELGGPEVLTMRQIIGPLEVADSPVCSSGAVAAGRPLPSPQRIPDRLTPDAVDFVNQPATVDPVRC